MEESNRSFLQTMRVLIIGLVVVIIVMGFALIMQVVGQAPQSATAEKVNSLANNKDSCVTCHQKATNGIVYQYGHSSMSAAGVSCRDCHEVNSTYPGSVEHEDTYVLASPTAKMCAQCHSAEVAQFNNSRHGLPAYVAYAGSQDLSAEMLSAYEAISEGSYSPDKSRNAIAELEGEDMNLFTCQACHNIGLPAADGSVGQCQSCHLRHEFSLEQVRKPETCNACHIGPDHPQWEIYQESPHGIAYMTLGHEWNWEAETGTLKTEDFPAPTCAVCHISGFGNTGTSHDVGDRLTWYLFAPISTRRPTWQDNAVRMQAVCLECHNSNFVDQFYANADKATERVNEWVEESNEIIAPLKEQNLLTSAPFDEPIDFTYFNLWHHWGRTAKFGVWMQGADYSQWHGAYEVLHDLAELKEMVGEKLENAKGN